MDCEGIKDDKSELFASETFSFETEVMPLKGNSDYSKLRKCLILLESQRTQALKDIDTLLNLQDQALADPLQFVSKLESGADLGIPLKLKIPDIPEIDWTKYKIQVPIDAIKIGTRPKPQRNEDSEQDRRKSNKIRGRVKDESKPSTFNKLWTVEEQLKLEELLMKYPPCHNEARRFAKIAQELGSRTLKQVTSRCQKYFKKLYKAGLPIPGRAPRQGRTHDIHRNPKANRQVLNFSSTFFPKSHPPVHIVEDGDLPGTSTVDLSRIKEEPVEIDDEDVSEEVRNSDEFRKLTLIKRVKRSMEIHGENDLQPHHGYRCDICDEDPLLGTRWNCVDCSGAMTVDLCSPCIISQLESDEPHNLKHSWAAYRPANNSMGDTDYDYNSSQYNYLDPNFQPE